MRQKARYANNLLTQKGGTAEEIQALMQKELCCEQSSSNQWLPEDSNRKYYEKSTSGPNLKK